jgi:hypothetical protein
MYREIMSSERYLSIQLAIDPLDERFRHMLIRRGYTYEALKHENGEVYARIRTGGGWYLDWHFQYETLLHLLQTLERWVGAEHIICICKIPYYRRVAGEGLTHWYEFRAVANGPDSEVLEQCSSCGRNLHNIAIHPIDDMQEVQGHE